MVVCFYCLLFSCTCYLLMVLPRLSALYCLSMFIVFDVLLACFASLAHLSCSHIMCENSKLLMFTLLLLITGSHASKWEPIASVFGVTIVIELSCVHEVYRSPAKGNLKRSQTSTSSIATDFYFIIKYKNNGMLGMRKELDT